MKIAIIASGYFPVIDGVTVSLHHRLRILSQQNHQVLLLCPDYQPLASIYPDWQKHQGKIFPNVEVISLPSEPFMGVKFERNLSSKARHSLQQALETFGPEIIHVDEPDRIFLGLLKAPGIDYARKNNIPCVGFYHTNFIDYIEDFLPLPKPIIKSIQWFSMLFIRPVFHAYDLILTASPVTQQRLEQLNVTNTVCDRYLGVDTQTFKSQPKQPNFFQTQYNIPKPNDNLNDKTKLIFLGRLTPDKGWDFTLKALSALKQNQSKNYTDQITDQIVCFIVGEGELRENIRTKLLELGIEAYFFGRVAPEQVPALLANSDIHITTSEKETLGLTVLEAFAAGIPVIAPKAGGVTTHIKHKENGLLYHPQNTESFNQALSELLKDPTRRQQMGRQGQQDIQPYRWSAAVNRLVNTWEQIKTDRNNVNM